MKKLKSSSGETIVESLVSMLIIVLVFVFLVNAVMTSAHINASLKTSDVSLDLSAPVSQGGVSVTVQDTSAHSQQQGVDSVDGALYKVGDDESATYFYYEYSESTG